MTWLNALIQHCLTLQLKIFRNSRLFDDVARWSYKAIRQDWPDWNQWHRAVLSRAEMLNTKFNNPMQYEEYKRIAKSIAKWTHANFSASGLTEWHSRKGKLGGKRVRRMKISAHRLAYFVNRVKHTNKVLSKSAHLNPQLLHGANSLIR
jgi:hypothetical protein